MELTSKEMLPFRTIDQLEVNKQESRWLIRSLWSHEAVGILGGAPKLGKSWLGLDIAVSVASNTPCMGHFEVETPGAALIYLAEDSLTDVRLRIEAICATRSLSLKKLNLFSITSPGLRLDLQEDQKRLDATLNHLKPKLLLLDPLVRLHCLDENSSADISRILGFLRELQRRHHLAIILVHHASKRQYARPGQALRGSSDLHAFGDSNAYLARKDDRLHLTLEHRSAESIEPLEIQLINQPSPHLEVISSFKEDKGDDLSKRIRLLLENSSNPLPGTEMRKRLRVNNQRLGNTLKDLENKGIILKASKGWVACQKAPNQLQPSEIPVSPEAIESC